ncbi:MAG: membrane protein insertase YidC, partial [Desulfovibrio sp.]|nr:membrane protein insertase YidC [Desulfovibrio sp.]
MENKNLILAVVLCLIVLFGWGRFAEYMGWVQPTPPPGQETPAATPARPAEETAPPLATFEPSPGQDFEVETPLYQAVFYTGGGPLRSFILKKYKSGITPDSADVNMVDAETAKFAPLGLVINSQPSWSTGQWTLDGDVKNLVLDQGATGSFTLSGLVDNLRVQRHFRFRADTYLISEKITLVNDGGQPRSCRLTFTQAMDSSLSSGSQYDSMRVAWDANGKLDDETSLKTLQSTGVQATGKIWW